MVAAKIFAERPGGLEHMRGLSHLDRWMTSTVAHRNCNYVIYICNSLRYSASVITSFKSRALRRFWTKNDPAAVSPDWRRKIHLLLAALDEAEKPEDMTFPGSGFHTLAGDQAGRYALTVSRNWRITFAWKGDDAIDVDLEDYHGR